MAKKTKTATTEDNAKLERLNALRKQLGMAATESTINLDDRIATLEARVAASPTAAAKEAKKKPAKGKKADAPAEEPAAAEEEKSSERRANAKAKEAAGDTSNGDVVRLGDLCKKLKIEPRAARIRLRKAGDRVPARVGDSWRWASKDAPAVEAIIVRADKEAA